jgi:hypothetical protein
MFNKVVQYCYWQKINEQAIMDCLSNKKWNRDRTLVATACYSLHFKIIIGLALSRIDGLAFLLQLATPSILKTNDRWMVYERQRAGVRSNR